ncbi:MAG TPA: hypothetical protein VK766_12000 [Cytophagaceae bacterium]|nr:hypothetical protein [Cytophagaceae bacterium]
MKSVKKLFYFGIVCAFLLSALPSCQKKAYPCPGLGQSSEADLSKFDENGQLKTGKKKGPVKRIDHDSGLVNKKSPKQIKAPRKTHL